MIYQGCSKKGFSCSLNNFFTFKLFFSKFLVRYDEYVYHYTFRVALYRLYLYFFLEVPNKYALLKNTKIQYKWLKKKEKLVLRWNMLFFDKICLNWNIASNNLKLMSYIHFYSPFQSRRDYICSFLRLKSPLFNE